MTFFGKKFLEQLKLGFFISLPLYLIMAGLYIFLWHKGPINHSAVELHPALLALAVLVYALVFAIRYHGKFWAAVLIFLSGLAASVFLIRIDVFNLMLEDNRWVLDGMPAPGNFTLNEKTGPIDSTVIKLLAPHGQIDIYKDPAQLYRSRDVVLPAVTQDPDSGAPVYSVRVRLLNQNTRQPLSGVPYLAHSQASRKTVRGLTDAEGHIDTFITDRVEGVEIFWQP